MATNFIQDGYSVLMPTADGLKSGAPFVLGNHVPCVLNTDAETDSPYKAVCATRGIFSLNVWGWNGSARADVAVGDPIYFDASGTTAKLSKDSSKKFFGVSLGTVTVGSSDTKVDAIDVLLMAKSLIPASIGTSAIADNSVTNVKLALPSVKVAQYVLGHAALTATATSQVIDTTIEIPKGCVALRSFIDSVTGFTGGGATTATVTLGDGTDPDRYNTTTPSIFATADTVDAGVVSGTAYHSAEKNLTLTVASDVNVGTLTAGSATLTVVYLQAVDHS